MREASQGLWFNSDGAPEKKTLNNDRFTLKHIAESNRIALAGKSFFLNGEPIRLACNSCSFGKPETLVSDYFPAIHDFIFSMNRDQFVCARTLYGKSVKTGAGTCTKF